MSVFIKKSGGLKKISQVNAHVKYIGFRSQEKDLEKTAGFFDIENDSADYKGFVKRIEENKAIKHPNALKAHKLIFSLKEKDYEAYLRSGKDYKYLIRKTLEEYEKKHDLKLDWIASIHEAEGHPHTHIVIKSVSDEKDKEGRLRRIYLKKDDFKELKDIFNKEFEREVQYKPYERIDLDKTLNDIGKGFEAVAKDIQNEIDKKQYENDYIKQKDIKKNIEKNKEQDRER